MFSYNKCYAMFFVDIYFFVSIIIIKNKPWFLQVINKYTNTYLSDNMSSNTFFFLL